MQAAFAGIALCLVLSGCAGGGSAPSGSGPSAEAHSVPAPIAPVRTWDVIIQGKAFINDTVTVYAGDSVRWTHLDGSTGHSVMANDMAFSSNDACMNEVFPHPLCMTNGDSFEVKFAQAGSFQYHCHAHHDTMHGTVVVVDRPG